MFVCAIFFLAHLAKGNVSFWDPSSVQGKRLTVTNATKIFIGQPIFSVAIAQLTTYKIYLAPVIFRLRFVKKLFLVDKIIRKNR